MDVTICPSTLTGAIGAIASKSMAHRLLILAALAQGPCTLECATSSADIEATASCLSSLGLRDARRAQELAQPRPSLPTTLDCGESGSTLRFLLPVAGALGLPARMLRAGRLANRPFGPFARELCRHGMHIVEQGDCLAVEGTLTGGRFVLPGNVSSQYASGLLMAAPLLDEPMQVMLAKPVESKPYINLTLDALSQFGARPAQATTVEQGVAYEVFSLGPQKLVAPEHLEVEGDWSNAAFWLAAGALEREGITVFGLNLLSAQGDRTVLAALASLGARIARRGDAARATADSPRAATFDVSAIPDLVPPLAAVCATTSGTSTFANAGRLRLKESNRLQTVCDAVCALGGKARVAGDDLVIEGVAQLDAGVVDAANDHRIAMMAAVMATHARGPVTILDAGCVSKSYPGFWEDYARLGGIVQKNGA
ncbi:MAG: 3-phosphoshikimate 1-carboxyvinyltransferase [Coriobacteriales bacterium]|nr:3-phosphoshikimate 1-carboxyvinyltransferase [Coriobacteriales bacterium]